MDKILKGKVALVTGAFGGLGHEFARMLGEAGASVGLAGRRMTDGRILEAELASQGVHALAVKIEVTDRASVEDAVDKVSNRLGSIDILVNNAGIASSSSFLDQTEEEWNSVIGVNLTGAWRVAQVVARKMRDHGNGGSIINISSVLASGFSHMCLPTRPPRRGSRRWSALWPRKRAVTASAPTPSPSA